MLVLAGVPLVASMCHLEELLAARLLVCQLSALVRQTSLVNTLLAQDQLIRSMQSYGFPLMHLRVVAAVLMFLQMARVVIWVGLALAVEKEDITALMNGMAAWVGMVAAVVMAR